MRRIFILVLMAVGASWSCAQTITVLDRQSSTPIEGVVLISESPREMAVTDAMGRADISNFKGSESIQIRSLGYETRFISYNQIRDSSFQISLKQTSLNLEQVVVSATRWRQSSGNVPSKITSIPAGEMALQNPQTAADLLGISNKVFIQKSQQGGGSPMIRGFATNRLLYTVDGVRMNNAIFRGGNIQNVINIDPFAVESAEVLFGPGSVIYGSDAIGGVMSFRTLEPELAASKKALVKGRALTRFSSANDERTGHFDVNIGWKKWSLVSSFSSWDFDHLRQGSNGPDDYLKDYYPQREDGMDVIITQDDPLLQIPSAYSQLNFMQKARFRPDEHWDFQYGFHFSETSPYGRYDRHNRVRDGHPRYAEWRYGPQKWSMHNFSVSHERAESFYDRLTLRLAQQSFVESRISRDLNSDRRERRIEEVDAWSASLDLKKSIAANHTLFYGAEYVFNDVASNGMDEILFNSVIKPDSVVDGPDRYPQATWSSIGVYLSDEFRLSNQLSLQAGLRYNQFMLEADFSENLEFYPLPFTTAEIDRGSLTGSLGAVYRPSDMWVIKANFGTAFRAPNVDDVGKIFDSEQGSVVVPNPGLDAEYAYNLDLGFGRLIGDAVKIDVTGFYTILQNAMVRRNFLLNGMDSIVYDGVPSRVQAIQNAATARVYGIQAGIEIKFQGGFSFLSDLNFQKGEEELDNGTTSPSRHAAPLFGSSRLIYRNNDLTLELNAAYQGEQSHDELSVSERDKVEIYALDEDGNTYAPSWYTLNLKASYNLSETFSLSAGLENLSDQRYRPYSSGISAAGRNFILSLRAKF